MNVLDQASGERWALYCGDSAEVMSVLPDASVHLTVTSIPFGSLFTYSPSERDLGNCRTPTEFWDHFGYFTDHWRRVTVPGRLAAVHVQQVPLTKATDGVIGLRDFRGETIAHFVARGWVYHGEICIDKDPQAQAIRTHSKSLLFVQLRKDSSWMRPAFADYVLLFRAPGDNPTPVKTDLTNDEWIEWARPIWYGIRETNTLNAAEARGEADERHICPLQLGTIERAIRLWTNPGEVVLDPFAGIGSTVREAVRLGRRGLGVELNERYYRTALRNIERVVALSARPTLLDALEAAG